MAETKSIVQLLCDLGLTKSFSESRRLIHMGAVTVNGKVLDADGKTDVVAGDVVRVGKSNERIVGS